jgi:hypothetical protein
MRTNVSGLGELGCDPCTTLRSRPALQPALDKVHPAGGRFSVVTKP